jgi:DNA repair protein RadA/Sms
MIIEFKCKNCGYVSRKWLGQCVECGQWNSIEKVESEELVKRNQEAQDNRQTIQLNKVEVSDKDRFLTGIKEFDRALGGGLVIGSVIFLSGFPGSGKSTLMLQVAEELGSSGRIVHYIAGEESRAQVKFRANRLGVESDNILILADRNLRHVLSEVLKHKSSVVIVDSLQTMHVGDYGAVERLKKATETIVTFAKNRDIPFILIGHITKDGDIAGPEKVQHEVDTVLSLQGDNYSSYRILKVKKNRFGSDMETGVFEMREEGMVGVGNPANMFLLEREKDILGSVLTATMDGNRCMLLEIQAFVGESGQRKFTCLGVDQSRVSLMVSILEKLNMIGREGEIFVNVTGGKKIDETGVDLAIVMAILSSSLKEPVNQDTVIIGEVGLAGDIRGVSYIHNRVKTIEDLGFGNIVVPKINELEIKSKSQIKGLRRVKDCLDLFEEEE